MYLFFMKKGGASVLGFLWLALWQFVGWLLSIRFFHSLSSLEKLTLGSVCGSVLSIWAPIPFSFVFGFTAVSHLFASVLGLCVMIPLLRSDCKAERLFHKKAFFEYRSFFLLLLPFLVLCIYLLITHTLRDVGGALYTGQCTFGDMAMHLGFITSLAEQGRFPPEYSILPGERLCYPFLCDSVSSSLLLLGLPLRAAYILPAVLAFVQVFCGFYLLACAFCRRRAGSILAFLFFFLNGGLGLIYFVRDYSFHNLFTGFYHTPTNLTDKSIRWVNVIVDMLLPQRATLFGWAALFSILLLLFHAVFHRKETYFLYAGVLGGLLPMIHTHSYLALGLVAVCWLFYTLLRDRFTLRWLRGWLLFGLPAVFLALPQLALWTFHSVGGNEQFLRFHFDWVNGGQENWLWFWFKNVGPLLLLIPFAFFFSDKQQRAAAFPAVFIFVLCEIFVFQPNVYDNNKLFYISYAFFCMLSGDCIVSLSERIRSARLRAVLLSLLLVLTTNAALLTIGREVISGLPQHAYRLFSRNAVSAADYIRENTDPGALFLTTSNHNNSVAALSGRNVFCGCPSYLFYHGLDYRDRLALAEELLTSEESFERLHSMLGIDYVYLGDYERGIPGCCVEYFELNYPVFFQDGNVKIFFVG